MDVASSNGRLLMKGILISQVDSGSVLKTHAHTLTCRHHMINMGQYGTNGRPLMSLVNAKNFIFILTIHVMFTIPIVFFIYRTKIIVPESVTVLY